MRMTVLLHGLISFLALYFHFSGTVESFDTLGENTGRSTPRLSPPKKESAGAPYRSTRFGFRLNRPNSTGVTVSKNLSCDNVNNNNADIKPNGKILIYPYCCCCCCCAAINKLWFSFYYFDLLLINSSRLVLELMTWHILTIMNTKKFYVRIGWCEILCFGFYS